MKPTSRMWISAGVVGVILAGGASIAVAASAGRIDRAQMEREGPPFASSSATPAPGTAPGTAADGRPEGPAGSPDDVVVSRELTTDPESVLEYWTEERMRDARPQPMPVIVVSPTR